LSTDVLVPRWGAAAAAPPRSIHIVGGFLVGGFVWGIVARLWMRLITADPEFTWSGTLFILVAFTIAGTAQGVALAVRRRGSARGVQTIVRTVALVLALPLGAGAGIVMLPTLVTGSVAVGRTDWRWGWRVAVGTIAVVNTVAMIPLLHADLPWARTLVGWATMLVVYAVMIGAIALTVRPLDDGWRLFCRHQRDRAMPR
jgi:hypothetical protein